jgi:DNA-binding response OmpR family regulator
VDTKKNASELQPSSSPRILIVDDQKVLRNLLSRYLQREGFEPLEAEDGRKAMELYRATNPAVVLSDIMMPEMDGLGMLRAIRAHDPQAAVILMTGYGSEDVLLEALRAGAVNFFKKPFDFQEVLAVVRSVARHRVAPDPTPFRSRYLLEETKLFELTTADLEIQPMINQIALHLSSLGDDADLIHIRIGIEEMINNAVEHGHLGITLDEKHQALERGEYGELIRQRLSLGDNARKRIRVATRLGPEELVITIRDEGPGFDWKAQPALTPEALFRYNGRGILLTRIYFDEVRYNDTGNEVTLIRRRRPVGRPLPGSE